MKRIEQIDDIAAVVVNRRRWRIGGAAVESTKLRCEHTPALIGQCELRLPHPCIDGKGVKENERAARALGRPRHTFEITKPSGRRHALVLPAPAFVPYAHPDVLPQFTHL